MKGFLKVCGILFFLYAAVLLFVSNLNLGTAAALVVGLLLFAAGWWWEKLERFLRSPYGKPALGIFCVLGVFFVGMMGFLSMSGQTSNADFQEDAVIVLGAAVHHGTLSQSLKSRLDACLTYLEKNERAVVVVSGGMGPEETVTEAAAMKGYLMENGIDSQRILEESQATSTYENFMFSKQILDAVMEPDYRTVFITNDFHRYRAEKLAQKAGFIHMTYVRSATAWYLKPSVYLREMAAVLKMWVVGR